MDQTNIDPPQKHYRSFWPLFVIFILAAVAGAFVYMYRINLETDYDVQSIVLTVHRRTEQKMAPAKKAPAGNATSTQGE